MRFASKLAIRRDSIAAAAGVFASETSAVVMIPAASRRFLFDAWWRLAQRAILARRGSK